MVTVNKETCIGCQACVGICPEVFEMKDEKSYIKKGQENSTIPCVKEAIDGCPVDAIS